MSVHTSLRRKAVAFPVTLIVAFGAAGFAAAPAYAAPAGPAIDETTPVEVIIEPDAADEAAADAAADQPAADEVAADPTVDAVPAPEAEAAPAPGTDADADADADAVPPVPGEQELPAADGESIPFTVLSPAPGATTLTRTVLFAGTGTDGAIVTLTDDEGAPLPGTVPVTVAGGAWTTTATYADDAETAQSVVIVLTTEGGEPESQTVSFALPAPDAEVPFEIVTPMTGETLPTRTVVFSGTGAEGAVVTVLGTDGQPLPGTQPVTVVAGMWLVAATYADDAPVWQTATVTLSVAGEAPRTLEVWFDLPAVPALPAPVITSPAAGEVITGDRVTFRGTGQPGAFVGLFIVPTALVEEAALGGDTAEDEMSLFAAAEPAPAPADPTDPIPVAADGTWSVTAALAPEDYTVVAFQAADATGTVGLSDPSAPLAFSLRAAPAVTPVPALAGSGSSSTSNSGRLAATGGEDITGLFGISILVMLAGAATVVATRRRALQG